MRLLDQLKEHLPDMEEKDNWAYRFVENLIILKEEHPDQKLTGPQFKKLCEIQVNIAIGDDMAEIIKRKWKNGKCIEETKSEIDWEPNEADLDRVKIGCECGNQFDMPRDCLMFGFKEIFCGQCGKQGLMKVIQA